MNRLTSVYLDLVRFLAALLVLFVHARHERFTSGWLLPLKNYGNDAVMVFFVLSGFVIAYCVDQKEKTLADYTISRLSRLYSVVTPALVLTVALDTLGYATDPSIYNVSWFDNPVLRVATNFFFINQLWFSDIGALSAGAFWSLGYEFWYYVLFGLSLFVAGTKRILMLAVVAAIIGPKILLLLPVWMMGAWAYSVTQRYKFSMSASLFLFVGSILFYVALRYVELPVRLGWNTSALFGTQVYEHTLAESRNFLFSYVAGVLVTANFIGFSGLSKHLVIESIPLERTIRYLASYTFTLYLLHQPLLNFFAAVLHHNPRSVLDQVLLFLLTLVAVLVIGNLTEHKKTAWRKLFEKPVKRLFPVEPSGSG